MSENGVEYLTEDIDLNSDEEDEECITPNKVRKLNKPEFK